jgi:hypothetical protein
VSLSHAFKTNEWLLNHAVRTSDTALMGKLLKKDVQLGVRFAFVSPETYAEMGAPMARFLAENYTEDVSNRWGYRTQGHSENFRYLQEACVSGTKSPLVFDAFINTVVAPEKQCALLVDYISDEKDRLPLLDKILKREVAGIKDISAVARLFVSREFKAEFDMLVTAGLDVHRDNEALLRYAAENEKTDFCRHLVTNHGADIDIAIITARTKAEQKVHDSLLALRTELKPDAPAVPTIEGLFKDLTSLRATVEALQETVAELTTTVRDLQKPAWQMDKKSLPVPSRN